MKPPAEDGEEAVEAAVEEEDPTGEEALREDLKVLWLKATEVELLEGREKLSEAAEEGVAEELAQHQPLGQAPRLRLRHLLPQSAISMLTLRWTISPPRTRETLKLPPFPAWRAARRAKPAPEEDAKGELLFLRKPHWMDSSPSRQKHRRRRGPGPGTAMMRIRRMWR